MNGDSDQPQEQPYSEAQLEKLDELDGVTSATEGEAITEEPPPSAEEDNKNDLQSDPVMAILTFAVSWYLFKLWREDKDNAKTGKPHPKAFPGAFDCGLPIIKLSVMVSLAILVVEILGEYALGTVSQQSDVTWIALLGFIAAGFYEELLFRGFGGDMINPLGRQFVVLTREGIPFERPKKRRKEDEPVAEDESEYLEIETEGTLNKTYFYGGIAVMTLMFMFLHPYLWEIDLPEGKMPFMIWDEEAEWTLHFDNPAKWWSTLILCANSVWWFIVRYHPLNPTNSLWPCVAGHVASNIGVFIAKLLQGHVVGFW